MTSRLCRQVLGPASRRAVAGGILARPGSRALCPPPCCCLLPAGKAVAGACRALGKAAVAGFASEWQSSWVEGVGGGARTPASAAGELAHGPPVSGCGRLLSAVSSAFTVRELSAKVTTPVREGPQPGPGCRCGRGRSSLLSGMLWKPHAAGFSAKPHERDHRKGPCSAASQLRTCVNGMYF